MAHSVVAPYLVLCHGIRYGDICPRYVGLILKGISLQTYEDGQVGWGDGISPLVKFSLLSPGRHQDNRHKVKINML